MFVTVSGARELYPVPRATECVFSYCSVFELFYSLSSFWSIKCYEFGKMWNQEVKEMDMSCLLPLLVLLSLALVLLFSWHCFLYFCRLILLIDLADEKFAALNLSSTSLADPVPKTGSGIGLQKASMDDIRPNGTSQSDGRVASWAINIMQLLTDNVGVQLFRVCSLLP